MISLIIAHKCSQSSPICLVTHFSHFSETYFLYDFQNARVSYIWSSDRGDFMAILIIGDLFAIL